MLQFKNMITCIDMHTLGEPLRLITAGFPPIPGKTVLEKRAGGRRPIASRSS